MQQRVLAASGLLQQHRLDASAQCGRRGDHHHAGVTAPAGEVDDAEHLVRDGMADRHAGAGQVFEMLDVVLVAEHPRRPAALERGADAVGAHVLLGVAEAGRQPNAVQVVLEARFAGVTAEYHAVRIAEDNADRLAAELVRSLREHRSGGPQEGRLAVHVGLEGHLEVVGRDVPVARPGPRRQDRLPDPSDGLAPSARNDVRARASSPDPGPAVASDSAGDPGDRPPSFPAAKFGLLGAAVVRGFPRGPLRPRLRLTIGGAGPAPVSY